MQQAASLLWKRAQFTRGVRHIRASMSASLQAADTSRSKAVVRIKPEADNVTIALLLAGKQRNLNRPLTEPVEKPLSRMRANVLPPPQTRRSKKVKKQQEPLPPPPSPTAELVVELYTSTDPDPSCVVPPATPNSEAWRLGRLLRVGDVLYDLELNPPTVEQLLLPKLAMVGFPLFPVVTLVFAEEAACQWKWLRRPTGSQTWSEVDCSSRRYVPTDADLGYVLRCECTPLSGGRSGEAASAETGAVEAVQVATAADIRQPGPPEPTTAPQLRVMSYNILADQYASNDYAKTVLFNYCPQRYLDPDYRKQLVLQELERYAADVVCLQEVDEKLFHDFLLPNLRFLGYEGRYTNKMGKVKEGSATFYRASRFQMVASRDILLRDAFRKPLPPLHAQFAPLLEASPALTHALQKVTTIAQATLLVPTPLSEGEGPLCVVNTHLFFHPYAPHIRTMHSAAILEEASQFLGSCQEDASTAQTLAGQAPTLVFCGDLNSDLNDGIPGVVELLQSGQLPADFWDWEQGAAFHWGKEEEGTEESAPVVSSSDAAQKHQQQDGARQASSSTTSPSETMHGKGADFMTTMDEPSSSIAVTGVPLTVPFKLRAADDLKTPYTNYTSGYKALLDYVWYEPNRLEVTRHLPVPPVEALASFIPSQQFPSDHLPVIYDFTWRQAA